jgi:hypothetical protein
MVGELRAGRDPGQRKAGRRAAARGWRSRSPAALASHPGGPRPLPRLLPRVLLLAPQLLLQPPLLPLRVLLLPLPKLLPLPGAVLLAVPLLLLLLRGHAHVGRLLHHQQQPAAGRVPWCGLVGALRRAHRQVHLARRHPHVAQQQVRQGRVRRQLQRSLRGGAAEDGGGGPVQVAGPARAC